MTAFLQCINTRLGLGNLLRRESHITKNSNRISTLFGGTFSLAFGLTFGKTLCTAFGLALRKTDFVFSLQIRHVLYLGIEKFLYTVNQLCNP